MLRNVSRGTTVRVFQIESETLSLIEGRPLGMILGHSCLLMFLVKTGWKPSASLGGGCRGLVYGGWEGGLPRIDLSVDRRC